MEGIRRLSLSRILLGLALLTVGFLLIIDQAGWMDSDEVISEWWPLIIIALGIVQIVSERRLNIGTLVVTLVGVILLLISLDVIPGNVAALLLPLALMLAGIWVLLGRSVPSRYEREDTVRSITAFGGADIVQGSEQFAGGTIVQLFGGTTLDLRQARLASEGASIDALAAFGGIDIIVPRGWRIAMSGIPLFGGYSIPTEEATGNATQGQTVPLLSINVLVAFGGIDVKFERS